MISTGSTISFVWETICERDACKACPTKSTGKDWSLTAFLDLRIVQPRRGKLIRDPVGLRNFVAKRT